MSEGLAEYASLGWDLSSEFFMLDATTFGYVAPPTVDFGGFLAYKGGQLFLHFVETTYGKGTVTKLIQALTKANDLPQAFKKVTKTSLEEAGEIWLRELRFIYWPELGQRKLRQDRGPATDRSQQGPVLLQPAAFHLAQRRGDRLLQRSRDLGSHLHPQRQEREGDPIRDPGRQGRNPRKLPFLQVRHHLEPGQQAHRHRQQEERQGRHPHRRRPKKNGGRVIREIAPDVQAILSPSGPGTGSYLAFSGMEGGMTDIYVWDLEGNELRPPDPRHGP